MLIQIPFWEDIPLFIAMEATLESDRHQGGSPVGEENSAGMNLDESTDTSDGLRGGSGAGCMQWISKLSSGPGHRIQPISAPIHDQVLQSDTFCNALIIRKVHILKLHVKFLEISVRRDR